MPLTPASDPRTGRQTGVPQLSVWTPIGAVLLVLVVLAATLWAARRELRERVREQIVARDAVVLNEVMRSSAQALEDQLSEDPATQLTLVLETSRLRGVLATRLFDPAGGFVQAFPPNIREGALNPEDFDDLSRLQPVSRFHESLPLTDFVLPQDTNDPSRSATAPVLEVNIPLRTEPSNRLVGIAQFILEGSGISAEFERLDAHLNRQAIVAFIVSGTMLVLALSAAFRKLSHSYELLQHRTLALARANRELVQSAKTTAIGAVTSHLIHELRNPLSGLHTFVRQGASRSQGDELEAWQDALSASTRMHATVQEITNLLREEQSSTHYQMSQAELGELVVHRLSGPAMLKGVQVRLQCTGEHLMDNRTANLVALILVNLAQNGIHATPPGKTVEVNLRREQGISLFRISDQGPGFPEHDPEILFHPKPSTREGGSGLGLAICKQLANHLGATLALVHNTPEGCTFELRLDPHETSGSKTSA